MVSPSALIHSPFYIFNKNKCVYVFYFSLFYWTSLSEIKIHVMLYGYTCCAPVLYVCDGIV